MKQVPLIKLFLLITAQLLVYSPSYTQVILQPEAIKGIIDVGAWDFEKKGSIELNGEWLFMWGHIVTPANKTKIDRSSHLVKFPDVWSGNLINNKKLPSFGVATYQLTIKGLKIDTEYGLKIPDMYCSYQLWIGNQLVAKNGILGNNNESNQPQWLPQTVSFQAKNSEETLLLNIANYHHAKGGIKNEIILGDVNALTQLRQKEVNANLVLIIGIALLSLISLVLYYKYSNSLFLYFSIFSLLWAIRGLFSSMYLIYNWFPDFSWIVGVKIEYLTIYCSVLIGYHIFHKQFPYHSKQSFNYVSMVVNGIFILLTLFTPAIVFTKLLNIYFIYMTITLLYVLNKVTQAYIHDEKGAGYISIAITLVIFLFFYDMLSYYKFLPFNPFITSIGYVVFYFLLGFSIHYNMKNKKVYETYHFS